MNPDDVNQSMPFLQNIANSSSVGGLLLLIAWWFKQSNEKTIAALDAERKDRINSLECTVEKLDKRSADCESHRASMAADLNILKQLSGAKFSIADSNSKQE